MKGLLTVVARLRAAKGKGDALAALLIEQCGVILKSEPGCLVYRIHRGADDPDAFVFYESYADEAALDAHRRSPHLTAFRKRREEAGLLDGPVEVSVLRALSD